MFSLLFFVRASLRPSVGPSVRLSVLSFAHVFVGSCIYFGFEQELENIECIRSKIQGDVMFRNFNIGFAKRN